LHKRRETLNFARRSARAADASAGHQNGFMAALELKGKMASLTRLRLLDPDLAAIRAQLEDMARRAPDAVAGMPVVVDADFVPDLGAVCQILRNVGMQPIAVADGRLAAPGRAIGMAVLPEEIKPRVKAAPAAAGEGRKPARIVDSPVRSGQQIYADGCDLVVTATVSEGAELIADGCIHCYGVLRGRAIAGARGEETARIFVRKFEAELVAVAGVYAVAEQLQGYRGANVQAHLAGGKLKIEVL
jgi:septum site-determining protein MinC